MTKPYTCPDPGTGSHTLAEVSTRGNAAALVGIRLRRAEWHDLRYDRTYVRLGEHLMATREQAAVLALVERTGKGQPWYLVSGLVEAVGGALKLLAGDYSGFEDVDRDVAEALAAQVSEDDLDRWIDVLDEQERAHSTRVVTVVDDEYPTNLRAIYNRPPFLFIDGSLLESDSTAISIVGTREASPDGIRAAHDLATSLSDAGVTIVSGLAKGIDASAHEAALDAGGRTIAVLGTGINRTYPAVNKALARRIAEDGQGGLVSQFWPDTPPTRATFPLRNAVTSGLAQGSVVIEAGPTSGAKMQARLCLEHGKRLFLIRSLVMQQEWAQKYAQKPGTTVVDDVRDIVEVLTALARPVEQLRLGRPCPGCAGQLERPEGECCWNCGAPQCEGCEGEAGR